MGRLGPHISYRRYLDRTLLVDHRTRTTYELNDAGGETLDWIERNEPSLPDEQHFVNELRGLGILDATPQRMTKTDNFVGGTPTAGNDIFDAVKRYGEKNCIPFAATFSVTYRSPLACPHRSVCGRCPALSLRSGGTVTGHADLDCRTARAFTAVRTATVGLLNREFLYWL